MRSEAPTLPGWLDAMLPFDRYRVDVGAWRMHVMEVGDGPTVVCVHGNPTWGFLYRHIAAELAADFRVVMPDLVGLGLSDKPHEADAHTVDAHARWLQTLLDAVVDSPMILVVQDWGGPIGTLAAAAARAPIRGLVVLNTVLGPPREGFRPTGFHRFAASPVAPVVFRGLGFPQTAMWTAQGDRLSIRGDAAKGYRWPLRHLRDNAAPLAMARMVPDTLAHPSVPALERCADAITALDVPTAMVWGDADPVLGRAFKRVRAQLPDHTRVTRTRGGHFLQEEVPADIAAAIRWVDAQAD